MKALTSSDDYDLTYVLDHHEWASLGPARVVNLGGSQGYVSITLAKRFPDLTFVVQDDMEQVVEGAAANLPADLTTRVQFMAHDLFNPQTVVADVYFLRWDLHNWSNKYCALILKAQIPALKPGATILIQEFCMPNRGEAALCKE